MTEILLIVRVCVMRIDKTLARLLSNFFLDIAKAFFIATFITPTVSQISSFLEIIVLLTKGMSSVTVAIGIAWYLAKGVNNESNKLD